MRLGGALSDKLAARACLRSETRQPGKVYWDKTYRCFFARHCQGVHLRVGSPLCHRSRDLGSTAFIRKKASEALSPLLTYQCVIWLPVLKCLSLLLAGACADFLWISLPSSLRWERLRSYSIREGTCVGLIGALVLVLTHTCSGIQGKFFPLPKPQLSLNNVERLEEISRALPALTFHKYLKPSSCQELKWASW